MKIGQCSETSAYKIQTPGNYPEGIIQHTEHSESLKSGTTLVSVTHVEQQFRKFLPSEDSSGVVAKLLKAIFT